MNRNYKKYTAGFYLRLILFCFSGNILLVSCLNDEVCEDVASVPVRIGFYAENPDETADNPVPLSINNITIFGAGNDSILYKNQDNVSQVELPLDANADSCAFIFRILTLDDAKFFVEDTLWLFYHRKPNLISMECGFTTFFELTRLEYSRNIIDSVEIDDANITTSLNEHVKIYPWYSDDDDL